MTLHFTYLAGLVINTLVVTFKCKFYFEANNSTWLLFAYIQPTYWHALHYYVDYDNVFRQFMRLSNYDLNLSIQLSACTQLKNDTASTLSREQFPRFSSLYISSFFSLVETVESQTQLIVPWDVVDLFQKKELKCL